ncbi:MAG: DUF488 domain-containing protein [Armatimonadetes bacterium]|nr:DUF488 domain-containing protein [Armatimonadota bacterium]
MKLLFLLRQESSVRQHGAFYDFLPYKYGPYSFAADRELRGLVESGFVMGEKPMLSDAKRGEAVQAYCRLSAGIRVQVSNLVRCYSAMTDNGLVDDVYVRYPHYAVLSERNGPPRPREFAQPAVYTMGYEGVSVDAFLNALIRHGVARLVDVRNNPMSRRYGFAKKTLSGLCEKIGVEYMHLPALGIPSSERQSLSDYASYQELLDRYEKEMLPQQAGASADAANLTKEKATVLVCFEADVRCCHRGRLASRIAELTGLPIHHLEARGG